jgi:NAD(P)-dependent dehydrogenase (short-subunit alcohol dehydrogenase family)
MMLKDKIAVVYGAGGAIGGSVARAFADEGARVFVTGRHRAPVNAVNEAINSAGGTSEAATIDALDEDDIENHLGYVVDQAGRVDISFNAIGNTDPHIMGVPLTDQNLEQFLLPITSYAQSYFLTARLAARLMVPNKSGVIMTATTLHSRTGLPLAGGYGPAQAAKEALTRQLSAELSPHGVRVIGLRPQAMPESVGSRKRFYEPRAAATGMTWEQFQDALASRTHPRRLLLLEEMANVAAFMASDRATGMTGTSVNLTLGSLDD